MYHTEGRAFNNGGTWRYEYTIRDHLGNTRLAFTDKDADGVVDVTNSPATNEVLQENHYYPFGLAMAGPWMDDAAADNRYLYNGKELHADHGLNWYDYGARWYDPSVGRWWSVDPLAQGTVDLNPFNYCSNSPCLFIDPNGLASKYNWDNGKYEDEKENETSWDDVKRENSIGEYNKEQSALLIKSGLKDHNGALKDMFDAALDCKGNIQIFLVKSARDAVTQIENAYNKNEIENLFISSHGSYDNASFEIGNTKYSTPRGVKNGKNIVRLGKRVSENGNIIILACHTGSPANGGVKLTKSVAQATQRTTFANQSWGCSYSSSFCGTWWGIIATAQDGKCGTGSYSFAQRPNAYNNMGKWTKASIENGKPVVSTVTDVRFSNAKLYYND